MTDRPINSFFITLWTGLFGVYAARIGKIFTGIDKSGKGKDKDEDKGKDKDEDEDKDKDKDENKDKDKNKVKVKFRGYVYFICDEFTNFFTEIKDKQVGKALAKGCEIV